MKKISALLILALCALLATAAFAATPEPGVKCGGSVNRWICAYVADGPGDKPAGWYTPSTFIPAGKTIYKSCTSECIGWNPITGGCIGWLPNYVPRLNHANDYVLASGAKRVWCGTNASHASEYWTLP